MHGDITRATFDRTRRYTSVRLQQGRVALDADWNEDRDIALDDERLWRQDVMGRHGAPGAGGGLKVSAAGNALTVSGGRYYVDGLRLDVPDKPALPTVTGTGTFLVHVDAWERTVTAAEDPAVRDVALGGPDTATRTALTWRLGALPIAAVPAVGADPAEWTTLVAPSTGRMRVTTGAASAPGGDPDLVPASAGYRGLTNRTYRVQVHKGNLDPTTGATVSGRPTVLWARDNASVLARRVSMSDDGTTVRVDRPGPGGADGFRAGLLAELTTLERQLDRRPGLLCRITRVDDDVLTLERLDPTGPSFDDVRTGTTPTVRCWGGLASVPGDAPGTPGTSAAVGVDDDGLAVAFATDAAATYRAGDFWIVPARTATTPGLGPADLVDWPRDGDTPRMVPPHGPAHHWARLAVVQRSGSTWSLAQDNRRVFAPLSAGASDGLGDGLGDGLNDGLVAEAAPEAPAGAADAAGAAVDTMRCDLLADGVDPLALDPSVVVGRGTWTGRLALRLPVGLDEDPTVRALHAAVVVAAEVPVADGAWAGATVTHRLPGEAELVRRDARTSELYWRAGDLPALQDPDADDEVLVRVTVDPTLLGVPGGVVYRTAFTVQR